MTTIGSNETGLLLAIDIGNTEMKLGVFRRGELVKTWRLRTDRQRTADEYAIVIIQLFHMAEIATREINDIVIASVVPPVNQIISSTLRALFACEPRFFRPTEQRLMHIATERPGEVGADLVAAAIAARERCGAPVIVISFGTATAYAAISPEGAYLGVAIAPGIQISIDALVQGTAKLPQVSLEAPAAAIGRTTVQALQSGILFGVVGQAEGIVARFRRELGLAAPVVACGGFAEAIYEQSTVIDAAYPYLVLEGLAVYAKATATQASSQ